MAEIRIEQKRRSLRWLWLLLALLLVAALAWYFLYPGETDTPTTAAPPTTGALDLPVGPASGFVLATAGLVASRVQPGGSYGEQG